MINIRNGGFELGTLDYWDILTDGVIAISDVSPVSGVYCLEVTGSGANPEVIVNQDYIEVKSLSLVSMWLDLRGSAIEYIQPVIYAYDRDYTLIDTYEGYRKAAAATDQNILCKYEVPPNTQYIRYGIHIYGVDVGDVYYLDNCGCAVHNESDIVSGNTRLMDGIDITGTFHTLKDKRDMQGYNTLYADISAYDITGTNPTLDVNVYERSLNDYEVLVGTFAQLTTEGSERIKLTNTTGKELYVRYVLGGTTPVFSFKVDVLGVN